MVLLRRRALAAVLAGVAVLGALRVSAPPPVATVPVTVAGRDLAAGVVVTAADLAVVDLPPGSVPDGLAEAPVGRTLAAPLRRGEPVTDVRLVGPGLAAGYPGLTLVPVRFPDAAAVGVLRPGDRIDVVAADPRAGDAETVAAGAVVVTLLADATDVAQLPAGRLVLLAVPAGGADTLSVAQVRQFVTYVQTD